MHSLRLVRLQWVQNALKVFAMTEHWVHPHWTRGWCPCFICRWAWTHAGLMAWVSPHSVCTQAPPQLRLA